METDGPRLKKAAILARDLIEGEGLPYLLGGGLAVWQYGHPRASSDVDFYLLRHDAAAALDLLAENGFRTRRSDPHWIYQAWKERTRIDLIFSATSGIDMNRDILSRGCRLKVAGHSFNVVSPEDLIAIKISIQYESRPDWWDAASIIQRRGGDIDWAIIQNYSSLAPAKFLAFCLWAISESRDGVRPISVETVRLLWQTVEGRIWDLPQREGLFNAEREDWLS